MARAPPGIDTYIWELPLKDRSQKEWRPKYAKNHEHITTASRLHHERITTASRPHHERITSASRPHRDSITTASRPHHDRITSAARPHESMRPHEPTTPTPHDPSTHPHARRPPQPRRTSTHAHAHKTHTSFATTASQVSKCGLLVDCPSDSGNLWIA